MCVCVCVYVASITSYEGAGDNIDTHSYFYKYIRMYIYIHTYVYIHSPITYVCMYMHIYK